MKHDGDWKPFGNPANKIHRFIFYSGLKSGLYQLEPPEWKHNLVHVDCIKCYQFMMTSSNGNIFALLVLCEGNPPVTGGFPSQRPVTRSFDAFVDLRLNNRLNKQARRRRCETPSRSLWRHIFLISAAATHTSRKVPSIVAIVPDGPSLQ